MSSGRHLRWMRWTAWALPVIILGFILVLRPFWGLMDDASNVHWLIPRALNEGLASFAITYGKGDLAWGMFRPTYPLMAWLVYWPGMNLGAPWLTFVWNALIAFGGIYLWARVLSGILKIPLPLLLLANGAFFYGHDLFLHPSLQEKMLLPVGATTLWLAWNRDRISSPLFWSLFALVVGLGASVKASYFIHYCVAVAGFVAVKWEPLRARNRGAWVEAGVWFLVLVLLLGFFGWISSHGGYTSRYSYSDIFPNLRSFAGAYLLIPMAVATGFFLVDGRNVWLRPEVLLPLIGVAAFVVIMGPWGIQGYIQIAAMPFFAALSVQVAQKILPGKWEPLLIGGFILLSLTVTVYRSWANFTRLSDLGRAVTAAETWKASGVQEIWMPCEEGSLSMQRFFDHRGGRLPKVQRMKPEESATGKVIFFDQALCILPGKASVPSGCSVVEKIWDGAWTRSFRLQRCN